MGQHKSKLSKASSSLTASTLSLPAALMTRFQKSNSSSSSETPGSSSSKKYRKVLILSLDAAGKTSFLYRVKTGEMASTVPTIGYNHETIEYRSSVFDFWDIGGQDEVRKNWDSYFYNVQAIIFVIDSNDRERMNEVLSELRRVEQLLYEHKRMKAVVLILANKQDLPDAMSYHEIHSMIFQSRSRLFHWEIKTCCIKTGVGVYEALGWLHAELKKRFK